MGKVLSLQEPLVKEWLYHLKKYMYRKKKQFQFHSKIIFGTTNNHKKDVFKTGRDRET